MTPHLVKSAQSFGREEIARSKFCVTWTGNQPARVPQTFDHHVFFALVGQNQWVQTLAADRVAQLQHGEQFHHLAVAGLARDDLGGAAAYVAPAGIHRRQLARQSI